ncbi:MAG: zinc metallopeptidase [Gammaproteobacteria bacterium]|nr:zinc metallopeptidase [Gammaproteobacteria bacterium]
MRWRGRRQSENVEDRRGQRAALPGMGGRGPSLLPLVMRLTRSRGGWVILVAGAAFLWLSGADLGSLLGLSTAPAPQQAQQGALRESAAEREQVAFISVVLADTEDTWGALFAAAGRRYAEPQLVLFRDATPSACGLGQSAMGPFYCPADRKVYLDLAFFDELAQRFGAPGDFAQAYVLAHEVGHHVQTLLGTSARNHAARERASPAEANRLSVRLELQADCYAGVWAHHAQRSRDILEAGDVDEALGAASAVGDDRLQHQAQGRVTPDSFTHGTSEQRVRWFRAGFEHGSLERCDTFSAARL